MIINKSKNIDETLLIDSFRDKKTILALSHIITNLASKLPKKLHIMEVCGGHTHTLMRYGLNRLLPENIEFIHGPGCPVCIMPKNRIDQAYDIASAQDTILLTLGDMMKVPGSKGSLQDARANGKDVRFIYSPLQAIEIASKNPDKKVIYFAIGFETTTPMTASLLQRVLDLNIKNLFFHINHVLVPPPLKTILSHKDCKINALIAPSHVSVITGAKIYKPLLDKYRIPIVVSGFEPVDMMESILKLVLQTIEQNYKLEIQYSRIVNMEGNTKAQKMVEKFMIARENFEWRGLGNIPYSALKLKEEYTHLDAEIIFDDILNKTPIKDNKACRCGDILRGVTKPPDCKVFGKSCTPLNPLGSCMVSSEGACAAYYKYGELKS
ncbi:hydrogenase formation protein HypD [Helicobacter sp. 13S00482-2]|uniref:hydrogenase formation protein HypD n=1 Tax=Helicobacter sp. 13S00482-2 TaxID=1476200 RepID=UPI000BA6ED47|nr:hydrogenase formation protein HypD [Helicobacter sp. 13S00482-2]PAF53156.1 hydrogenase formation protein HypD [Helicobacter sp. 13S00482-2]